MRLKTGTGGPSRANYTSYLIILFGFLLTIKSTVIQSSEQKCIISNGVPNHKIGKFPTKGNPNIFKKQKLKKRLKIILK